MEQRPPEVFALPLPAARELHRQLGASQQQLAQVFQGLSLQHTKLGSLSVDDVLDVDAVVTQLTKQLQQASKIEGVPDLKQSYLAQERLLEEYIGVLERQLEQSSATQTEFAEGQEKLASVLARKRKELQKTQQLQTIVETEKPADGALDAFQRGQKSKEEPAADTSGKVLRQALGESRVRDRSRLEEDVFHSARRLLEWVSNPRFRIGKETSSITDAIINDPDRWVTQFSAKTQQDLESRHQKLEQTLAEKKQELEAVKKRVKGLEGSDHPAVPGVEMFDTTALTLRNHAHHLPEVREQLAQLGRITQGVQGQINLALGIVQQGGRQTKNQRVKELQKEVRRLQQASTEAQAQAEQTERETKADIEQLIARVKAQGERAQRIVEAAEATIASAHQQHQTALAQALQERDDARSERNEERKKTAEKKEEERIRQQQEDREKTEERRRTDEVLRREENNRRDAEQECRRLRDRVADLEQERAEYRHRITILEGTGKQTDLTPLILALLKQGQQAPDSGAERRWLEQQLREARDAERSLRTQIDALRSQLTQANQRNLLLEAQQGQDQREIKSLRDQLGQLQGLVETLRRERRAPAAAPDRYGPLLMEMSRALGQVPSEIRAALQQQPQPSQGILSEEEQRQLLEQLEQQKEQLEELSRLLKASQEEVNWMCEQMAAIQGDNERLRAENSSLRRQQQQLMSSAESEKETQDEQGRRIGELMEALEEAEGKLADAQQQVEEAQAAQEEAEEQVEQQQQEQEKKEEELGRAQSTITEERKRRAQGRHRREQLDTENQRLKEALDRAGEQVDAGEKRIQELMAEVKSLRSQLDDERSRYGEQIGIARGNVERGEAVLERTRTALGDAKKTNVQLRSELEGKTAAHATALARAKQAEARAAESEAENTRLKSEIAQLRQALLKTSQADEDPTARIQIQVQREVVREGRQEMLSLTDRIHQLIGIVGPLEMSARHTMMLLGTVMPDLNALRSLFIALTASKYHDERGMQNLQLFSKSRPGNELLSTLIRKVPRDKIVLKAPTELESVLYALAAGKEEHNNIVREALEARSAWKRLRNVHDEPPFDTRATLKKYLTEEEYNAVVRRVYDHVGYMEVHRVVAVTFQRSWGVTMESIAQLGHWFKAVDWKELTERYLHVQPEAWKDIVNMYLNPQGELPQPLSAIKATRLELFEDRERKHLLNTPKELELIERRLKAVA